MATANTEKKVTITLPLLEGDDTEQFELVGYNFKMYQIKRGEPVEVPEGVAYVLELSNQAKNEAIRERQKRAYRDPSNK